MRKKYTQYKIMYKILYIMGNIMLKKLYFNVFELWHLFLVLSLLRKNKISHKLVTSKKKGKPNGLPFFYRKY